MRDTYGMSSALSIATVVLGLAAVSPQQIDYEPLWEKARPFHVFLENVRARQQQWRTRFANAAIDADAITAARSLPGRRRILAVAEDRCSDSAWVLPYVAKLAAAVPEKLEVRVLSAAEGSRIQSAHLTPDGRLATPTIAVLDDLGQFLGAWVERPSEVQTWYLEHKTMPSDERYAHVDKWYTDDAGRSTIRELLEILRRDAAGRR